MIIYWLVDPLIIKSVNLRFNLKLEVSVLREERLVQELGGQRVSLGNTESNVHELTVLFVYDVMVAD